MRIKLTSLTLLLLTSFLVMSCMDKTESNMNDNPFFTEYDTPYGTPPFEKIKNEHYLPAYYKALEVHNKEIDEIINSTEAPSFENTIVALEKSGELLSRVNNVFSNLKSAHTNETFNKIAKEITPVLAQHSDNIKLNEKLFSRIKIVYDNKENSGLTDEQKAVLKKYYDDYAKNGAALKGKDKERIKEINQKLSSLTLDFGDKILNETNSFKLFIKDEADLAGLPDAAIAGAKEAATAEGREGEYLFTLHKPSLIPFLQYAENRELREKMFKGYINKGDQGNENDTRAIIKELVTLRYEKAQLLGYETHAHYVLESNMAKNPANVYQRLDELWAPALQVAEQEAKSMQEIIDKEGGNFKLEPWDWWFYAERVKKAKYDLDEEDLRPYFELENVKKGVFEVSGKLFGIELKERNDIQKYHEDVIVYEVLNKEDNSHVGILYTDYFPRASKRGGAWMDAIRKQSNINGDFVTPVIINVGNFSKPVGDKPSLLSLDETLTLFHEFGHALHGLLSKGKYPKITGTSVPRDFVEFPSQVMENWAMEPEVLKLYAKHYETGEPMPDELIEKIKKSGKFNQGFAMVEYLAASYLDMDWHTLNSFDNIDVRDFENNSMNKRGLVEEIVPRYRSTYFNHIFAGGYSAGYYSYIWSEILDADAFAAFTEQGIFNEDLAKKFKENILEKGGADDPMDLYVAFRGEEPEVEPLLIKRGLK
ncbi:MAG: dipeptidyl carboxypeptidase II [Melioribacteraceae bacterium]|nr:MAG: dipeptidyl carboxypeptidase II [Melioribacteraceae bacterium]